MNGSYAAATRGLSLAPGLSQAGVLGLSMGEVYEDSELEEEAGRGTEYNRWVQTALNQVSGLNLAVDGLIGPATRSAIRSFQQRLGLRADGVAGPATQAALVAAGAPPPPGAAAPPPVTPQVTSPGSFRPVPVENPGGGRIRDKRPAAPGDLVTVPAVGGGSVPLHRLAAQAWQAMIGAARREGIAEPQLLPVSGYRSPEHQARLWRAGLARYGSAEAARRWVAPPGSSAHQTGRAIDFYLGGRNSSANVAALRTLPAYRWLVANASRFGFYPYTTEPWHWEYNPPAAPELETFSETFEAWTLPGESPEAAALEGEVSRNSPEYVRWVQASLNRILGLQLAVDGIAGPHTSSAVRRFQEQKRLAVDGVVGPRTEQALIAAGAPPAPRVVETPRARRSSPVCPAPACPPPADLTLAERTALAVTTNFETGRPFGCAVSRVDGISMGMLQWNLKANTLQTLLRNFEQQGGNLLRYLGPDAERLRSLISLPAGEAVDAATAQGLAERWKDALCQLCTDPLFCRLQVQDIRRRMQTARAAAAALGLRTVRGLAMMFDIHVGDGYGRQQRKLAAFRDRIAAAATRSGRELTEREKLVEIADQAARYAGRWEAERRARRMVIANGTGLYRRSNWNLDQLFPGLDNPAGI